MSGISDPGKAGRGDRRRAQKLIDAGYAAGLLTAADRALRTDRVRSAHTKGDLAILVRDLDRTGSAPAAAAGAAGAASVPGTSTGAARSLGSAIPPEQLRAMARGMSAGTVRLSEVLKGGEGVRTVRRVVIGVLVSFFVVCGLGIAGLVTAVFFSVDQAGQEDSKPPVNLQTAEGWTELVTAVEEELGSSRVYDAVVYPEYASLNAVVDEGAMRYVYRDGAFQMFNSPVTPAFGKPVDLADIDAELVETLPDRSAEKQQMPDYESAYLIVSARVGDPTIAVYLQQSGRLSRWTVFDLEGNVVGGTP